MKNCWNRELLSPLEIVRSGIARDTLVTGLSNILEELAVNGAIAATFQKTVWNPHGVTSDIEFERCLTNMISSSVDSTRLRRVLDSRSETMYRQISPFLCGNSLIDVGCGDGRISWLARDRFTDIQLVDVVDYVDPRVQLPFAQFDEGSELPVHRMYDVSLLLTVLHHSSDPVGIFSKVCNVTSRRVIIIESVFGVTDSPDCPHANMNTDEQFAYAIFFDWVYNRVLHSGVPVPFNFTTPDAWEQLFRKHNMKVVEADALGVDLRIVPEYHYLYVLEHAT